MKLKRESGFILYEFLISLIILGVVLSTLLQMLPNLLMARHQLTQEQLIFNQIYQLKDELLYQQKTFPDTLYFDSPLPYKITFSPHQVCAHYPLGATYEKTLCL
ncbi:type II secretion system protein [Turicibacter sanguinis]|uniref:type II secretion system protein n=1 Tax=Turicibacter sanguinis TaxID=154288 RepID=UPI00241F75EB|nr:type II secretion system protein [Turicibacter sanguinis]